jgi:hypothetical protein
MFISFYLYSVLSVILDILGLLSKNRFVVQHSNKVNSIIFFLQKEKVKAERV